MYVYRIVNKIDGKCYVGITEDVVKRFKQHVRESRCERSNTRKLYQAIKDFGISNFCVEILEETSDEQREEHWITLFNSVENGYNHTSDGKGNRTPKFKFQNGNTYGLGNQIKKTLLISDISESEIDNVKRLYINGNGVRTIRKMTNVPDRLIFKIVSGIERKGKGPSPRKYILKIDTNGNVVGRYFGIKEAMENCGIGKNGIAKVLTKTRNMAGGFYWKYDE